MPLQERDIREYFDQIMHYFYLLAEKDIIFWPPNPRLAVDEGIFEIPRLDEYVYLRDETSSGIEQYIDFILGKGEEGGGVIFQDLSIALMRLGLDLDSSSSSQPQPRFFNYVYVSKETLSGPYYLRIDMQPAPSGRSFGHPIVHIHANRTEPRISIGRSVSPVEFIDFILRSFFPGEWNKLNKNCEQLLDESRRLAAIGDRGITLPSNFLDSIETMRLELGSAMNLLGLEDHQILRSFPFVL